MAFACNLVEWAKLRNTLTPFAASSATAGATATAADSASTASKPGTADTTANTSAAAAAVVASIPGSRDAPPPALPPDVIAGAAAANATTSPPLPPPTTTTSSSATELRSPSSAPVAVAFRMASHGAHDPTTLVPKLCRPQLQPSPQHDVDGGSDAAAAAPPPLVDYSSVAVPSRSLLDARGIFVVLLPSPSAQSSLGYDATAASTTAAAASSAPMSDQLCFLWKGARAPVEAMECARAFLNRLRDLEGYTWAEVNKE